eukprot:20662_4
MPSLPLFRKGRSSPSQVCTSHPRAPRLNKLLPFPRPSLLHSRRFVFWLTCKVGKRSSFTQEPAVLASVQSRLRAASELSRTPALAQQTRLRFAS